MSDTPETDAEEYCLEPYPHYVKSSFARRLERERNEALESLSSVRKEIITAANHGAKENAKVNQWLCTKLASAVRERDEARMELVIQRNELMRGQKEVMETLIKLRERLAAVTHPYKNEQKEEA